MFIRPWLEALKTRWIPKNRRVAKRLNQKPLPSQIETLEEKLVLSAFDLITVIPNQGVFLSDGATMSEAPREVTLRFSPGQNIDPATLGNAAALGGITIVRAGLDGIFDNPATPTVESTDDVSVSLGYIGIGENSNNEVVIRFAAALPDDKYEIRINGSGATPLKTTAGVAFNDGVDKTFHFELDLGAQVEAVVPQPVLRSQVFIVADSSLLANGDTITVTTGPYTTILEFNTVPGNVAPGHVYVNRAGNNAAVATAIANAISSLPLPSTVNSTAAASGGTVTITGSAYESTLTFATASSRALSKSVVNVVSATNLKDGDTMVVSLGATTLTLEFNNTAVNNLISPNRIRVDYTTVDSAATLAAAIATALNKPANNPTQTILATLLGSDLAFTGTTGTPSVSWTNAIAAAGVFNQNFGSLSQASNKVVVYFNQDQLSTSSAQDPRFYRLINAAGDILLPANVTYQYNAQTGLSAAVLTFSSNLPPSTYSLKVGVSAEPNDSTSNAIRVGTIFAGNPFVINEYLGDGNGTSSNSADVDLYQFKTVSSGIVTFDLITTPGFDGVITFLNSSGGVIGSPVNLNGAGGAETLMTGTLGAGVFYVSVSSSGGTTGGYQLKISSTELVGTSDDNSAFQTATNLGELGTGGYYINSQIQAQGALGITMPPLPGGPEEPGHRDLPTGPFPASVEPGHGTSPGSTPVSPGAITVITYNFPDQYGTVLGQPVYNQITPEQKALARQVFEMYAYYTGVQFREISSTQLGAADRAIVTGDIRALAPNLDPGAAGGIAGGGLAIMNASQVGNDSTYGSGWMTTAFHEIGHTLGLGHSYDVPSVQGAGVSGEAVYPGDNDLVHLLRIYRNDSSDIDLYKFNITQTGTLSAQTIAERLQGQNPSDLNTVLTLYQESPTGVRTIIARNDDFYSNDSGLDLQLAPGTYYIGVTSTGNTNYDPSISDSGNGGVSDGRYDIQINFTPQQAAASGLRDTTNRTLDGDHDGKSGGEYSFSFVAADVAQTKIVDKLAPAGGTGTLASPYQNIKDALAASAPGDIVRIVGNGGADRDASTVADNVPYAIGKDYVTQNPLADGATFQVPKGVTVMIDAATLIKVRGETIDVGTSSALGQDRSNGSLQVLGTPVNNVYFTSWRDDAKGSIDDGTNGNAAGADWGGLVFRQDSDSSLAGVFLNYVGHATIQYGGGQVSVDGGQLRIYNAIDLETSRPTIVNNILMNNADAAISANPNSFKADDGRIGPDIHGNVVTNNSTNGLFIRIQTALGSPAETLDVLARFDDTDITHVITQNLIINGQAGGSLASTSGSTPAARLSGRLQIDPGMVIKLSGARIETGLGNSNLIAEGTAQNPIRFTSQQDDRYGAGGTFDVKNDGNTSPTPGNWAGFFMWPTSTASFDHVSINYAGGTSEVAGSSASFNPMEIFQANVRVANSVFEDNLGGGTSSDRNGRGGSDSSVIYVRGAQPQIINNIFRDNIGNVISINANSMQAVVMPDLGRTTGAIDRFVSYDDNYGPLVRLNTYQNNSTNGMNIRAEELAIESVWDDTDIAHVVRGLISSGEFHTYGGLRLQSSTTGSLVVKLQGATAGFLATGDPLEIADRIGGTVQIIGQPGFPVILTSLKDDTVSTGFLPNGFPLFDTNNNGASVGSPGDWNSVAFNQYSNDTNVAIVLESEPSLTQGVDRNFSIGNPQPLGNLAPNLNSGDENRRLGFEVHGFISPDTPSDVDVYSFTANAGTEVWIDLDQTSDRLDAMVELLNSAGQVVARSLNSQAEGLTDASINAWLAGYASDIIGINRPAGTKDNSNLNPLTKDTTLGGDFYTSNFHDAGFRLVLPGLVGQTNTYFVRVRSQPLAGNQTLPLSDPGSKGLTSGAYQLQVRLQQRDQQPGSTVRFADIRYATNGVQLIGLPAHSPLMGESAEQTGDNNTPAGAQNLGPLLQTDRNTISVSGSLSTNSDVDFFQFSLDYSQVQVIGGLSSGGKFFPTMFDIDWADGLTRPDTIIAVYNENRDLIYIGRDSDTADDQPAPGQGQDLDDLSRGSLGRLDPSVGTVNLPAGVNGESEGTGVNPNPPAPGLTTYYVAVFSNGMLPTALTANFNGGASTAVQQVRLEPINSIKRIVEDHIGYQGYTSNALVGGGPVMPTGGPMFNDITNAVSLTTNVKPWTLGDVTMYVSTSGGVSTYDPFRGGLENTVLIAQNALSDLDMRTDGILYGYRGNVGGQAGEGILYQIDTGAGISASATNNASDNIAVPTSSPTADQNQTNQVDAVAWRRNNTLTATFTEDSSLYYSVRISGGGSKLYQARPNGDATPATNTPFGNRGTITGAQITGNTTGMQFVGSILYGVSDTGLFYSINTSSGAATFISDLSGTVPGGFGGLANPPQNVEGGKYRDFLFAISTTGYLVAINPANGTLQTIFDSNNDGIAESTVLDTKATGATGLAFSPIDFNLWHPTEYRGAEAGHGINQTPDNSRLPGTEAVDIQGRLVNTEAAGGTSFYFGLEEWQAANVANRTYYTYQNINAFDNRDGQLGNSTYNGINTQQDLTQSPSALAIGNNYNVPGGAYGSLVTNGFSLDGYNSSDKPTLYFNYWLDTNNDNAKSGNDMRDSARVFVSADGGLTWTMVATNNSVLSTPLFQDAAELPSYLSTSSGASDRANQVTQELFDTASWRQARVDLGQFAGQSNLIMRFDFSTSGVSGDPKSKNYQNLPGDANGSFGRDNTSGNSKSQNNDHGGFFIDDIIVGLASRGEMVTGSTGVGAGVTNIAANPFPQLTSNPDPSGPSQLLNGAYQLEIRRGQEYGYLPDGALPLVVVDPSSLLNVNDRQSNGQTVFVGNDVHLGDTVTIYDGLITKTFEFTASSAALPSGNIPVNIVGLNPFTQKGAIAGALATQINSTFASRNTVIAKAVGATANSDRVDIFSAITVKSTSVATSGVQLPAQVESDDTFGTATVSTITSAFSGTITGTGRIGDTVDGALDVDMYSMVLAAGQRMTFDLDLLSDGDSILKIFSSSGILLATSDDNTGSPPENSFLESFLLFVAPSSGTYYLAVSGYQGSSNPAANAANVFDYRLNITAVLGNESEGGPYGNDYPSGGSPLTQVANLINPFSAGTDGTYQITGEIGNSGRGIAKPDSDFFEVNLTEGQTITVNLTPTNVSFAYYTMGILASGSSVPAAIASNGVLTFTAPGTGRYFLGVFGDDGLVNTSPINAAFTGPGDSLAMPGNDTFKYLLDIAVRPKGYVPIVPLTVSSYVRQGDDNLPRTQGQIIIENNTILYASQDGIQIDDDTRVGVVPHPGAVLNTPVQNTQGLVTGLYIQNNVIARFGQNGINLTGDPNVGLGAGIVPFVKIVNNTIYGTDDGLVTGATTGIRVANYASPTLMNNAIVNTGTAVSLTNNSSTTELEANLFQGNLSAPSLGGNFLLNVAASGDALFVNASRNNFYPRPGSPLIDSSRSTYNDRAAYVAVTGPLGIPQSPILAPVYDRFGQLRVDDSNQSGPANQPGLGQNPFQDRGAIERADFNGGVIIPTTPQDNDGSGVDLDPGATTIWIDAANPAQSFTIFTQFKLQLIDDGIGIDDTTVNAADFLLLKNGVALVEGQDYFFTYNQNTNETIFTSVSTFALDSRYQIVVNAADIFDSAGNALQNNQALPFSTINPNVSSPFSDSQVYFTYIVTDGANSAPVNTAPTAISVNEDSSFTFSGANTISVDDIDAFLASDGDPTMGSDGGRIQVSLSLPDATIAQPGGYGTLTLGNTTNLVLNGGSVSGTGTVSDPLVLNGRIVDLREALLGLTYAPPQDYPGTVQPTVPLTIKTEDFGKFGPAATNLATTSTINITVNPVNDVPVFTKGLDQTVDEDTGAHSVPTWAMGISSGPTNESGQALTFLITGNTNSSLFSSGPTVAADGTLSYTLAPNASGFADITIKLKDDGGVANGGIDTSAAQTFRITVTPINDAPTLNQPADSTALEDVPQTVPLSGISAGPLEGSQTLVITAVSSAPSIVPNPTINYTQGSANAVLTYQSVANQSGGPITITVTITDNGGTANGGINVVTKTFLVNVTAVNDAPTLTVPGPTTVYRDDIPSPAPFVINLTDIGTGPLEGTQSISSIIVTSSDQSIVPDANITKSSVVGGAATLTIQPLPGQFGTITFTVTIVDDGLNGGPNGDINFVTKTFTVNLLAINHAPSFTLNPPTTTLTVLEDAGQQTINLNNISAGPPREIGQTLILSAVSQNTSLISSVIVSSIVNGVATVKYTPVGNASGQTTIRITLQDNGGTNGGGTDTYFQDITINVTAVNDAPTLNIIPNQPASGVLLEGAGQQTINLSGITTGPTNESGQTLTLTAAITSGNPNLVNNFIFSAVNGSGQATLQYTPVGDEFGTATVTVTVTDSGINGGPNGDVNVTTRTFTITVLPVNDRPTLDNISDRASDEDAGQQSIGLTGISVGPTNEAASQTLSFTIVSDNPGLIPNDAGHLSVLFTQGGTAGTILYTSTANASGVANITVTMKDNGGAANGGFDTIVKTFKITVLPVPDAPTNITLVGDTLLENLPGNTLVGTLSTTDADLPSDSFTYSVVGGTGLGFFQTSGNQLLTSQGLNYEGTVPPGTYTVVIRSTDSSTLFFEKEFTIHVIDVNEPATAISVAVNSISGLPNSIPENQPVNSVVGTLVAVDPDTGDHSTFTLVTGAGADDNALFKIVNGQLVANTVFNYEVKNSYTVRVRATDSHGVTFETPITITITNVNEAPTNINLSNSTVVENTAAGTVVGAFDAVDPDANETFTYTLVSGAGSTNNAKFSINASGELEIVTPPNYEDPGHFYTIRVRATDGGLQSFEKTFTITILNVNEAPTALTLSALNINENLAVGSTVGTFATADQDVPETFEYSLVTGSGSDDNAAFTISGNKLLTAEKFDFESRTSYSVRVRTRDSGGNQLEQIFVITINDTKDGPVVTLSSSSGTTKGRKAVTVDVGAVITDIDSTNFDGGKLVVAIHSGEQAGDTISIKSSTVDGLKLKLVKGKTVLRLGTRDIATVSGGVRGIPLTVRFGTGISPDLMQSVLRNITFKGKPFAAERVISVQAFDETGLPSNVANRSIVVT